MAHLDSARVKIFYEIWGDEGPWATLVNGWTRTHADLVPMAGHLERAGFRVLAADNRGAGKTESPVPFTLHDMASDIVALWDRLGIPKSHLLGISMGGAIALELALGWKDRLDRLVLVSTAARWPGSEMKGLVDEKTAHRYFSPKFLQGSPVLAAALSKELSRASLDATRGEGARAQREATVGTDFTDALGRVDAPTLVVHGGDDGILDVEVARTLARGIPGARLEIFEGAGHLLLAETPRKLYETAGRFFSGKD